MTTINTPIALSGPSAPTKPYQQNRVIVQIRRKWSDAWKTDMSLIPIRGARHIRRAGESEFHFKRNYGPAEKQPYETAYSAVTPIDISGWWVRVVLLGNDQKNPSPTDTDTVILFQGMVEDQTLNIGADSAGRMGVQGFKVIGPELILRKIEIYQSRWLASDEENYFTADWLPGFNIRSIHTDEEHQYTALEGNKSDLFRVNRGSFVFGGTEVWTNHDMLVYIVNQFVNQYQAGTDTLSEDSPEWTVGGQRDALETLEQRIPMGAVMSADEMIQRVIPSAVGVEYKIVPTVAGFEINIFSTVPDEGTYAGYSMPKNPNVWTADVGSDPLIARYAVVVDSAKKKYDKLRVIGNRERLCFSFGYGLAGGFKTLWPSSLGAEYLTPGGASWEENDFLRSLPKFKNVFRAYGPDPARLYEVLYTLLQPENVQTGQRRTMAELPLLDSLDYSESPPTDNNETGAQPDFRKPFVIAYSALTSRWHDVTRLRDSDDLFETPNVAVQPLKDDWGVFLNVTPGHLFAKNHWDGAADTDVDPDLDGMDYEDMIFTVCIELDRRLMAEQDLPALLQTGSGTTKVLHSKDAELWRIAPFTVVGIDDDGQYVTAHLDNSIVRDDTERIERSMAGAVAAYMNSMVNMIVEYKNLMPLDSQLGTILRAVEDGGVDTNLWTLVSSVSWDFTSNETELSAGYALASI